MKRTTRSRKSPAARPVKPVVAIRTLQASARKAIAAGANAANGMKESALGAIDTLVKQGEAGRKVAAARFAKARKLTLAKAKAVREDAIARVDEARARTTKAVSALEKVFEQRVSTVVSKLGVPSSRDVRALSRQVSQLQASVDQLRRSRSRARA